MMAKSVVDAKTTRDGARKQNQDNKKSCVWKKKVENRKRADWAKPNPNINIKKEHDV